MAITSAGPISLNEPVVEETRQVLGACHVSLVSTARAVESAL
jgi:hypothetical protein